MVDRFQSNDGLCVLVFTSPKAGSGQHRDQIPKLLGSLESAGIECHLVHDPDELRTRSIRSGETIVVAAGGDGTIALAASLVSREVPLLPMPLGTENLLAKYYQQSAVADEVLKTLRFGTPIELDVGSTDQGMFLIMATIGFDAEVVRAMHLKRKGHISRLSYAWPVVRSMFRYRFPAISVRLNDDEAIECYWAMVFNLPQYATGLRIEPCAKGDDGQLDVVLFGRRGTLAGMKYLFGVLLGIHGRYRDVQRLKATKIEIKSQADQRVPIEMDGDYIGRLPISIELHPKRVTLLTCDQS